ncbi:MAG TPA: transcriptional repressor LexA [Clostridiales bacterium]|jgi:repressor LexA|nr:transcriptional repressor LexA [Clostridiales bacterium]
MSRLTPKQKEVFDYIAQTVAAQGYPPSVREICAAVGLKSPSTVHAHLTALERAGLITRDAGKTRAITLTSGAGAGGVPILGTVAAGQPILAVEDALGFLPFDPGKSGEYFALRIKGDSMINAGILEDDMVVVRRQPTAENGEIVVALIEDEATCKTLRRKNGEVWLVPENDDYEPIDGSEATILGKVTAVIRTY